MKSQKIAVFYTTVHSQQEAETLATQAIQHNVAACINIMPKLVSFYVWNDNLERSTEFGVLLKTSLDKKQHLYQWLLSHHPYKTPAILCFQPDSTETFQAYVQAVTLDDTSEL